MCDNVVYEDGLSRSARNENGVTWAKQRRVDEGRRVQIFQVCTTDVGRNGRNSFYS